MEIVTGIFYVVTFLAILLAPIVAIGWIIYRLVKGSNGGNKNSIIGE